MKQKMLYFLLAAEAIVCIVVVVLQISMTGVFSAVIAFPFEQIGLGLRMLSLSGAAGNVAAIFLYLFLSAVPFIFLLYRIKHGFRAEDWLLGILSAVLFFTLYLMVNPQMLSSVLGTMGSLAGKEILGGTVYSILCTYVILRVLRLFYSGCAAKLHGYMWVMLGILSLLFVYFIFGSGLHGLLRSLAALKEGNQDSRGNLGMSQVFLLIRYAVDVLPYVLDLAVVFAANTLLAQLGKDRYAEEAVSAARGLSRLCGISLSISLLANAFFNIIQLLFIKKLLVMNSMVQIPLISIVFVLGVLLLSRYISENQELKTDNDSFI